MAFAVSFRKKSWGYAMTILSILVGVARVYVGVHYPADIAGGALVGFLSSALVNKGKTLLEPFMAWLLNIYSKVFPFLSPAKREEPVKAAHNP